MAKDRVSQITNHSADDHGYKLEYLGGDETPIIFNEFGYVDGDKIILKKYEPACIFCGNAEDVTNYKGKNMCKSCMTELAKQIV